MLSRTMLKFLGSKTQAFHIYNFNQCASFSSFDGICSYHKTKLLATQYYPIDSYTNISRRSIKKNTMYERKRMQNNFENSLFSKYYKKINEIGDKRREMMLSYSPSSLVAKSPPNIRPYLELARYDKPIGTLLLYFPCAYSICFATPLGQWPSFYYLALFGVGSVLMRGAGCTINDLWDRNLDKQVERTKERPIASGRVSPQNAIKFLALQLSLSLGILLTLEPACILIGCAAMVPVVLYPLAKRYTMFPQAVLGLTFNIGAIMGYVAVTGVMNWPLLMTLYASCFMWTLYYDLIYAFQDVHDDKNAGIKSMALLFQKYSDVELREKSLTERLKAGKDDHTRAIIVLCSLCSTHLFLLSLVGFYSNIINSPFVLGITGVSFYFLNQLQLINLASREDCWDAFNANGAVGLALTLIIIFSILTSTIHKEDVENDNKGSN